MAITKEQTEAIKRCQQSVAWFLRSFGKLKHPSAGILPFHPFSYQRKAIKAFRQYRFNIFRKCIAKGSMVWTPSGPKAIEDVKENDVVYAYDEETGEVRTSIVTAASYTGERKTVIVRTKTGHKSQVTPDHLFLTKNGWIEAKDLTTNDILIEIDEPQRYIAGDFRGQVESVISAPIASVYDLEVEKYHNFIVDGVVVHNCRQAGISKISGAFALWYAMFFSNKTILIISRTDDTAMEFLRDQILFLFENLPTWMKDIWKVQGMKWNDHELHFSNGSKIKSLTSHPDVLRSNASSLNIIDEAAFIPNMDILWAGGWSCTNVHSIVFVDGRLRSVGSLGDLNGQQWQDIDRNIQSDNGLQKTDKFYLNGVADTFIIKTYLGYSIECTGNHRLKNEIYEWIYADKIKIGDRLALKVDYEAGPYFNENSLTLELARTIGHNVRNDDLIDLDGILQSHQSIRSSFLDGLFNDDKLNNDIISSSENFIYKIQLMMLEVGIVTQRSQSVGNLWKLRAFSDQQHSNNGIFYDKVVSIEKGRCLTADLSVPSNNTYIANGFVSHNTLQHGGNVIVISTCVAPDTLVNTSNGICEIQDLAPDFYTGFDDGYYHADYNGPDIVGINGLEPATKFYKRPIEETRIVTTSCNYEFEASLLHKLPIVQSDGSIANKYVRDLQIGDLLPVKAGQMVFGNNDKISFSKNNLNVNVITEHLAYLVGVIIAEGHVRRIDKYTANVTIACGDFEVLDKCESWGGLAWNRGRVGQDYVTTCYTPTFVVLLEKLGVECTTAPFKTIPKKLLQCSEPIIRHFLRGLFDGDGAALTRNGQVCYISTSKKLIKQVRMLLFNYGIHTYLEISPPGVTSFKRANGEITEHNTLESYRLYVSSNFTGLFYDLIGFGLDRKQSLQKNKISVWSELMPPAVKSLLKQLKDTTDLSVSKMTKLGLAPNVLYGTRSRITKSRLADFMSKISYEGNLAYDTLIGLLKYDWFNEVKTLRKSESEVYDFTIPNTHTFIGDCTVHSNTNGIGNWYWSTVTSAEAGLNQFNPVNINWWDMDWVIEYVDPLSHEHRRIAPRDGLVDCDSSIINHPRYGEVKLDPIKYGKYWSPWLEDQYRALNDKGEAWKFEQEVLASFVGSGNTVLSKEVLAKMEGDVLEPKYKVTGLQPYIHPVTGSVEELDFDFDEPEEGLWIWNKPVIATTMKKRGNQVIDHGSPAHSYVMGIDMATGKGRDYSTIVVLDIDTQEQVAEFMARCLPREFVKYIDRLGRWFNCALAVVERNNGGDVMIDSLRHDVMYPRIWRRKDINDKPRPQHGNLKQRPMKVSPYGFATSQASKPVLNKYMLDLIRAVPGDGYTIVSKRLFGQFQTYVRKRDRSGRDTNKTEAEDGSGNHDDLVIACALALVGTSDAVMVDASNLMPMGSGAEFGSQNGPIILSDVSRIGMQSDIASRGGPGLLMPMSIAGEDLPEVSAQRMLDAYTLSLGGIPINNGRPAIVPKRYYFDRK